uniref:DUF834 domain-containing protein n=1 Tax=Oryza glumipatula TaxID=40148 RepID=A0A0E0BNR1_9ORYZ
MVMVVVVVMVIMVVVVAAEGVELEIRLLRELLRDKPPQDLAAVTNMESPIHMIPLIEVLDLGAARRRRWVVGDGTVVRVGDRKDRLGVGWGTGMEEEIEAAWWTRA